MRILVGTLHTIENEFNACCASIEAQTYRNFEHLVIRDLPVREAHFTLFRAFMRRADEFDLMVKVDADMVLSRSDLFEQLIGQFSGQPNLHHYQIAVHDFFTNRLIGGMNVYRNTLKWQFDTDSVFVENPSMLRLDLGGGLQKVPAESSVMDWTDLAPSAFHCKDPSPFQAFHFGMHKGIKVRQALTRKWWRRSIEHLINLDRTWQAFHAQDDPRLGLASLAGELALCGGFDEHHLSYSVPYAREQLETVYMHWDMEKIKSRVRRLRLWNRYGDGRMWRLKGWKYRQHFHSYLARALSSFQAP